MAEDLEAFARQCKALSRAVSALPKDVKQNLSPQVVEAIGPKLSQAVGHAARGPFRRALFGAARVRANPNPTLVVGGRTGASSTLSGGAAARDVVFGTEYGGGNRVSTVNRKPGKRGRVSAAERAKGGAGGKSVYKRHTTRQFHKGWPYVWDTTEEQMPWVLDAYADIILKKANVLIDQALG
ncbi:MAG TPA: hypothetical protein VIR15_07120 [Intrasporangium sp.]|uniref:hypothetical protein n=1 Tax=Intrasporangium sp. TaxID=1925024 RepID=UPI002F93301C